MGCGPLKEASRISLRVERNRFTYTVVDLRPKEHLAFLIKGPGVRINHIYELGADTDRAAVTITDEYRGYIGNLVVRFMRGSVRRDLVDELAAIKWGAEASL